MALTSGKSLLSRISLAAVDLSCSMWDLSCGMWGLWLWHAGLVPWPGIRPRPPASESGILATGPPGRSQRSYFINDFFFFVCVNVSVCVEGLGVVDEQVWEGLFIFIRRSPPSVVLHLLRAEVMCLEWPSLPVSLDWSGTWITDSHSCALLSNPSLTNTVLKHHILSVDFFLLWA